MENTGIQLIYADGLDRSRLTLKTNVVYAERDKMTMHMQIICHEFKRTGLKYPLVVFVNASGWMRPDSFSEIPQLTEIARCGYVVASIEHRGSDRERYTADGALFPDHVVDTKEAVRFLRAHADDYGIDARNVAVLGWATGAHTALMTAFTNGESRLDIGENLDYSSDVQAVVAIDGETDLENISRDRRESGIFSERDFLENDYPIELLRLFGPDPQDYDHQMRLASPIRYVTPGKKLPAALILNGDRNNVVPFRQAVRLYDRLRECGNTAELYKLAGAGFLKGVWAPEVINTIVSFLDIYLPLSTEVLRFGAKK